MLGAYGVRLLTQTLKHALPIKLSQVKLIKYDLLVQVLHLQLALRLLGCSISLGLKT
jgi:hypothetical protein